MSESGIFKAAVKLPPERRAAYLDQACGSDAKLRAEIESLLHAHDATGGFLEDVPAGTDPTEDYQPIAECPGTVIGPYKLMEQIGEGGMGLVFVAEQQHPIRRKVALKIIKPGMDTREIIARFEAERQALALMDHPNIARVFDAGTTESGRPYFVMELVRGLTIVDYCDSRQLATRNRLELFLSVFQAVQHAHSKGIIHRDLKPSNILVAPHDGVPVVKVIDFGVAKAIGQQLTDKTIYTRFAQMIGTPLYMSPEQVELNALDVDIRSDVYSLGVLLYELLTGTTPLDRQRLATASFDEMRRIIKEEEPPKPSTRLASARNAAKIASARRTEPVKLANMVRGELDWIVMKALEKDRGRRYQTAIGFATDLQRYLAGEPVLAAAASQWYRLRKLVRRHMGAVVAAGLVLLALLGGIAGTTWGLVRAVKERDGKDAALKAEQKARENETKAREQAFAALRTMTADVVERKFAQGAILTDDDRAFLRGVIAQYDAFAAIQGDDAESRAVRAEGRLRVGAMRHKLGELQEAEQDYDQALSLYQHLAADFPSRTGFRQGLADCRSNRGQLLYNTGRFQDAKQDIDQALSIRKQLAADFPARPEFRDALASSYNSWGVLLRESGSLQEVEQYLDQALTIQNQLAADFPSSPEFRHELAKIHNNRGNFLRVLRRLKDAGRDYDQAVSVYQQLVADFPSRPAFRYELAGSHFSRGFVLSATGRPKDADKDYDQAVSISKQLAAEFPARPEFRQRLAESHLKRGMHLSATGRRTEAKQGYDQALSIQKQMAAEFPYRPEFRDDLAKSHLIRGMLLSRMGQRQEAEQDYDQAVSVHEQAVADFPNQPGRRNDLASTCVNLASLHAQRGDTAAAKRLLLVGRPNHLAALKADPRHETYRLFYRMHLSLLTRVHAALLEQEDAVRTAETCGNLGWNAPADAYDAACFLSLCIPIVAKHDKLGDPQRKEAAQFYGDAAMKLLRAAVDHGYQDVAHMKKDTDLDPLRRREDFQKLIADLPATNSEKSR
jgi:tetratricopeptide (TPR) repeat protein